MAAVVQARLDILVTLSPRLFVDGVLGTGSGERFFA
jgi:hypothetical protein